MYCNGLFDEKKNRQLTGYSSLSEEAADSLLEKEIEKGEIANCLRNLKNRKTGGSDGIVGKLLKNGGSGMEGSDKNILVVQWNLIITVTLGPNLAGCYIEVADLLSSIQTHHN